METELAGKVVLLTGAGGGIGLWIQIPLAGHITGQTLVIADGMEGRWLWQPDEVNTAIA